MSRYVADVFSDLLFKEEMDKESRGRREVVKRGHISKTSVISTERREMGKEIERLRQEMPTSLTYTHIETRAQSH